MLLQLHESGLAGQVDSRRDAGRRIAAVHVLGRMRGIRGVHAGLWCAGRPLVGAPEVRKVERVGAYRGHFIKNFEGRWGDARGEELRVGNDPGLWLL